MKKILLIDDTHLIHKMITKMLEGEYQVFAVSDWSKANQYLFREKMDLILMDVEMPGVQGDKIAKILKETISRQAPKIVLFSALNEEILAAKAKECNVDGYICKTSNRIELISQIQPYLEEENSAKRTS